MNIITQAPLLPGFPAPPESEFHRPETRQLDGLLRQTRRCHAHILAALVRSTPEAPKKENGLKDRIF